MQKYSVVADTLMYGVTIIGPSSEVYTSEGQVDCAGLIHQQLPGRLDYVFCNESKVIGVESKHPSDLLTSQTSKRLARQMTTLLETVDVACLMLRGGWPLIDRRGKVPVELYKDLVRLQVLGVIILPGPVSDKNLLNWFRYYRSTLGAVSPEHYTMLRRAVSPDDFKKAPSLLRAIPGVGKVVEKKLLTAFGTPWYALLAGDDEWAEVVNSNIVKARKVALQ